jgi:hypothetical protein
MKGCVAALAAVLAALLACPSSGTGEPDRTYSVGIKQVEFADTHYGPRTLSMAVFYPAAVNAGAATPFVMPFFTNLTLYKDAEVAFDGEKRLLIMLSHGRGSNGLSYAWFAQTLASHGCIVAAPYHWRANTYDSTIAYLANRLWQRPVDISLGIDFLLNEPAWSKLIDPNRIGAAGHSQGGFTALWLGGAKVNRDKFLAFQQGWRNNQQIPEHLRKELPLDPEPALNVKDARIKAVFAMRQASSRPSAWTRLGLSSSTYRPISPSAPATRRRRRPRMPSSRRNASQVPSSSSSQVRSTTRSSSMNATTKAKTSFPRPARTRLALIVPPSMSRSTTRRSNSSARP